MVKGWPLSGSRECERHSFAKIVACFFVGGLWLVWIAMCVQAGIKAITGRQGGGEKDSF